MTKTIEEAAREYANENMWYPGETSYESDIIAMEDSFADAFKAGASHALSLPLSQRLTDEEREWVRKMYAECELIEMDDNPNLPADRITEAGAKMQMLEEIFGKELFREGEG